MSYRVINGKLYSVDDYTKFSSEVNRKVSDGTSFKEILSKEINKKDGFVISNHAAERLKERNITLNESDMNTINDGINKALEKGASESLILYKDVAFLTSIKNRTIITAVDKESSKGNVFTNIDSVVLL
ncbi:flagellar biosynthesis protein [Clostridium sp. YIM B02515]|uniref:Flagellar biosynthesis protein n=1 Tax=Clostridium rhizosphaerae TaxID=2803861 RepID=A0ABS1TJ48_9CLOT|nr:TIGR02530 family flagellar biosynthesis protein [Clostridium rhizosphaerae]MBL4937988.1 flagellar biosynthesis protein [Clostridium rhizosphaerae]